MTKVSDERLAEMPADLKDFAGSMPGNWPEVLESRASAAYLDDTKGTRDLLRATAVYIRQSLRSQPEPAGVRVKGLEWTQGWGERSAATPFGPYRLSTNTSGAYDWFAPEGGKYWSSTEQTAKAAAQADFERRILSVIDHISGGKDDPLRERLDRISAERATMKPGEYPEEQQWEADESDAAAIEIADAVIAWMVRHGLLDADHEYRDDDIVAVLDDLVPPFNQEPVAVTDGKFNLGDRVTKTKGSSWTGKVVGFYSTALTPVGYAVESENEPGSVQIYPEAALAGFLSDEELLAGIAALSQTQGE